MTEPRLPMQLGCEIETLLTEEIPLHRPMIDMAAHLADQEGTVLLLSGGGLASARYHILGFDPWLCLKGRGTDLTLVIDGQVSKLEMDPLEALEAIVRHYGCPPGNTIEAPLTAGLMGYLAYDLKDVLETLPRTTLDRWLLPHLCFYAPSIILVHDRQQGRTVQHTIVRRGRPAPDGRARLTALENTPPPDEGFAVDRDNLQSNFRRQAYEAAVQRIRDYIAAGDVYQVNLSQRFETGFQGNPFGFFRTLYHRNPAPFFAYLNAGDHQLVSTSPERFFACRIAGWKPAPSRARGPAARIPLRIAPCARPWKPAPRTTPNSP